MIKSDYLKKQIKNYFGKEYENMTDDEKDKVTMIAISKRDIIGNLTDAEIFEISQFSNLQRCLIQGFKITDRDIQCLNEKESLRGVQFSNCNFDGVKGKLNKLELIVLDGCENVPNTFFLEAEKLKFLRVIGQKDFDVVSLIKCAKLERIYFQRTALRNLSLLKNLENLKYVNLDCSKFNLLAASNLKRKIAVEYKLNGEPER